jgi:RNA polymerase primary sigma factor
LITLSRILREHHWRDILADTGSPAPIDAVLAGEETALIDALAAELPPVWRMILVHRYGLDGEPPMTLAAIGERCDLSRERVRQIEVKCLRRLRRRLEAIGLPAQT